ncbi:MAG: hypothetical protein ACTS5Y_10280 [Pollutimonas bauzanensis]
MKNRLAANTGSGLPGRRGLRLSAIVPGMLLLALAGGACRATSAQGAHAVEARLAALPAGQFKWGEHQALRLSGVLVYVKPFTSGGSAAQAAQSLANHADLFQRVLAAGDTIVLSGLQRDWHWLARIESAGPGSSGYVSALHVDAGHPGQE